MITAKTVSTLFTNHNELALIDLSLTSMSRRSTKSWYYRANLRNGLRNFG